MGCTGRCAQPPPAADPPRTRSGARCRRTGRTATTTPTRSGRTRSMPPTKPSRRPWPAPGHVAASRRHRGSARPRTLLRLLVGVVLLQGVRGRHQAHCRPECRATCQPDGDGVVAPQKITVNVFNSTTKAGLAAGRPRSSPPGASWSARSPTTRRRSRSPAPRRCASGPPVLPTGTSSSRPSVGCDASPGRAPGEHGRRRLGEGFTSVGQLPVGTRPLCPAPSTSPSS
jgi:hypothetical protein